MEARRQHQVPWALAPGGWELPGVGPKFESSGRTPSGLNHWASFPAFFKIVAIESINWKKVCLLCSVETYMFMCSNPEGSANPSYEWPESKLYFTPRRLCWICHHHWSLLLQCKSSHRSCVYDWARLLSNKTLWKIDSEPDLARESEFVPPWCKVAADLMVSGGERRLAHGCFGVCLRQ